MNKAPNLKSGIVPLIIPVIVIILSGAIIAVKTSDYLASTSANSTPGADLTADSDGDGFPNHVEENIGTDPNKGCGDNAWPVDFNGDGKVTVQDITSITQKVGVEYPTPGYNRYDLDLDGKVTTKDVGVVQANYFKSCAAGGGGVATPSPATTSSGTSGSSQSQSTTATASSPAVSNGSVPANTPSPSPKTIVSSSGVDINSDDDKDGFAYHVEANVGTDPAKACGANAWPADFTGDSKVTVADILTITQKVGMEYPTPGYNRYDLDLDGKVTSSDVAIVQKFYFRSCDGKTVSGGTATDSGGTQSQSAGSTSSPLPQIKPSPIPRAGGIDFKFDSDRDGFPDHTEANIGTNPLASCGENAWPVDFNSDGKVTVQDINAITQKVGIEYPTPGYNRLDLDLDGKVTTKDVGVVQSYYFKSCKQNVFSNLLYRLRNVGNIFDGFKLF